ncbi:hypothetical protein [Rhizobium leucaenae]|uniref:hypothetical protein n=1 Tax=Rhizobium leucaenae TaxID=29450 RepID=UPI00041FBE98|nr:hypothetical protein [Rhizobium leucaenae]
MIKATFKTEEEANNVMVQTGRCWTLKGGEGEFWAKMHVGYGWKVVEESDIAKLR